MIVPLDVVSVASGSRGVVPRGFTLIELMVAILVLGILLGVAVPSFREAALSSRLTGYANDLVASAQTGAQRGDQAQRSRDALRVRRTARRAASTRGRLGGGLDRPGVSRDIEVTTDDEPTRTVRDRHVAGRSPPASAAAVVRVSNACRRCGHEHQLSSDGRWRDAGDVHGLPRARPWASRSASWRSRPAVLRSVKRRRQANV